MIRKCVAPDEDDDVVGGTQSHIHDVITSSRLPKLSISGIDYRVRYACIRPHFLALIVG